MENLQNKELKRDYLATRIANGGGSPASHKHLAELNRELEAAQAEATPLFASLNMSEEWVLEQYKQPLKAV